MPAGSGEKFKALISRGSDQRIEEFSSVNIKLTEISKIVVCPELSSIVFTLLFFAINTTRESYGRNIERLHTSCGVKNGKIFSMISCEESLGSECLVKDVLEKINGNKIDYGVLFYFVKNNESGDEGVNIEIIHPLFSVIYFIPVEYRRDDKSLVVLIKSEKAIKLLAGDAVGKREKISFIYSDANGNQTSRDVLGAKMYIKNGREYINGFCLLRYEERHFRKDRIVKFI